MNRRLKCSRPQASWVFAVRPGWVYHGSYDLELAICPLEECINHSARHPITTAGAAVMVTIMSGALRMLRFSNYSSSGSLWATSTQLFVQIGTSPPSHWRHTTSSVIQRRTSRQPLSMQNTGPKRPIDRIIRDDLISLFATAF